MVSPGIKAISLMQWSDLAVNGRDKVICVNKLEANQVEQKVCLRNLLP